MTHPNFSPVALTIPWVNFDVYWYGIIFAFGIFLAIQCYISMLSQDGIPQQSILSHTNYSIIVLIFFTLMGARLIEAIFYSPDLLLSLTHFLNLRAGGLASHGAVLGFLLAMSLIPPPTPLSSLQLLDRLFLCVLPLLSLIRVANFINQEIIGKTTAASWAMIFPAYDLQARHPVMLYEAFLYALLFGFLWFLNSRLHFIKKEQATLPEGVLGLSTLSLALCIRIFCETYKLEQSQWMLPFQHDLAFTMGQLLSLLILVPVLLCICALSLPCLRNSDHKNP